MKTIVSFLTSAVIIFGCVLTANAFIGPMSDNDIWWYLIGCSVMVLLQIKTILIEELF